MELIKKGYESIRITFNWNRKAIKSLSEKSELYNEYCKYLLQKWKINLKWFEMDFFTNIEINNNLLEEETKIDLEKKSKFLFDYCYVSDLLDKLVDNINIIQDDITLNDRYIINYYYQDKYSRHRIIQKILYTNNKDIFWIWSIKIDWMFWRIKETTIFEQVLQNVENEILKLNWDYLNRVDFFFDYEWTIKEFLEKSKIIWFQTQTIFNWISVNNKIIPSEESTIYWWKKETKRTLARLYNKRLDTIIKKKQKYYWYISQNTKRFEVEVETKEIWEIKKLSSFETIQDLIRIIYKNTILKEYNKKWTYIKKYDIDLIWNILEYEQIIRDNIEKIKRNKILKNIIKNESSRKIKNFYWYVRNLKKETSKDLFEKILKNSLSLENMK